MRPFGFVLLVVGFLLCLSIVWAAIGFLMMGFGLICLLIAERRGKRPPEPDEFDLSPAAQKHAAPRQDNAVPGKQPATLLEPTFTDPLPRTEIGMQVDPNGSVAAEEDWSLPAVSAIAPPRLEPAGDYRPPPPMRSRPSSEFDRIRALRAERRSSRIETEFRDFSVPIEREQPPLLPEPVHFVPAPDVTSPLPVATSLAAQTDVTATAPRPEIGSSDPALLKADRTVSFDDADDLADLFGKFDLGKEQPPK